MMPAGATAQDDVQVEDPRPRITVLGVTSLEGDMSLERLLSSELRLAAQEIMTWRLNEREITLDQMTLANGCSLNSLSCLQQIAESVGTDQIIFGRVRRTLGLDDYSYILELVLFDQAESRITAEYEARIEEGSTAAVIAEIAHQAISELAATPDSELQPEPVASIVPAGPTSGRYSLEWLGYTLSGVAALAFGSTVGIWVRLNDLQNDPGFGEFRRYVSGDACTVARDGGYVATPIGLTEHTIRVCNEANQLEILQYGVLGLSLGLAAAGIALLVFEAEAGETRITFVPSVGPERAYLAARINF